MIKKTFLTLFILTNAFSSYEKIKIGNIDSFYSDKITYEELRVIIDDIEATFESQLGINVFDYSEDGKPIDILYVPPTKMEQKISKKFKKLEIQKSKIEKLNSTFEKQEFEIDYLQKQVDLKTNLINGKTEELNIYIQNINKKGSLGKDEYIKVKEYIQSKKIVINNEIEKFKNEQKILRSKINKYNQKVSLYRSMIGNYNRLKNELEKMTRSFKKIKGTTFSFKEITLKTYYKNGKVIKEKSEKNSMNKIEIYGFDNISELKAVIAHEIAHLVGIPHIDEKNALMNPILQSNQLENLYLTNEDITNFLEHF